MSIVNVRVAAAGVVMLFLALAPLAQASSLKPLYTFTGTNGAQPGGGLIDFNGLLYGTVPYAPGGLKGEDGFVFSLSLSGQLTILDSFGDHRTVKVANPRFAPLRWGNFLYIVTNGTTRYSYGTAVRVRLRGGGDTIHYFVSTGDGQTPTGGLIRVGGLMYGTTNAGGDDNDGTVYSISPRGEEKVVYSFKGGADGKYPGGSLLNVNGVLYGTTSKGGGSTDCPTPHLNDASCGTVFSVTTAGVETVLHEFHKDTDGGRPLAGVIRAGGKLVGTASIGGPAKCHYTAHAGCGTVFTLDMDGSSFHVAHSFQGADGANPKTPLLDEQGILYGTTPVGGDGGVGTIFSLDVSSHTETVLYSFEGDEGYPSSGLIASGGNFFGETSGDGDHGFGMVYSFIP